ncbi:MAG: hypothetical protein IT236_09690 [Bacteroidia bacterium]|nr:hypothetical protein [Bacteroidia bacterium]
MKLTDFLISRQHGLSKNILVDGESIFFNDIKTTLEIKDWKRVDVQIFRDFVSKYTFPKNEEFSKKDRDGIRNNIPEPQILIQKAVDGQTDNSPLIAMYLYQKSQLTGDSLLHIRSINKFEQMWLPYFINFNPTKRDNPKVQKKDFYEYCVSTDINLQYTNSDSPEINNARLRVLSFAFNSYVLLMYAFDKNNLTQEDLLTLANNLKSST